MEEKDLKKLKRPELLEIMLAQSEEIDRLRAELAERDRQLADRQIAISQSGSIAEASLRLTKVFEEAQKAADLYLDNVKGHAGVQSASATATPARGTRKDTDPSATTQIPRRRVTTPSVLDAPAAQAPASDVPTASQPAASHATATAAKPASGRHFGRHVRQH